jgi:hypothetical protein
MTDSWGNLKISRDLHTKWSQVCSLRHKEVDIKLITAKYSETSAKLQDLSAVLDDGTILAELDCLTTTTYLNLSLVNPKMRDKAGVCAATLDNNCWIEIEAAKRTRLVTIQRGISRMIHPSLMKRYKTNDRKQRYRRLPVTKFTDTMYSPILSRQHNKAA